jgi:hypothetical protein
MEKTLFQNQYSGCIKFLEALDFVIYCNNTLIVSNSRSAQAWSSVKTKGKYHLPSLT